MNIEKEESSTHNPFGSPQDNSDKKSSSPKQTSSKKYPKDISTGLFLFFLTWVLFSIAAGLYLVQTYPEKIDQHLNRLSKRVSSLLSFEMDEFAYRNLISKYEAPPPNDPSKPSKLSSVHKDKALKVLRSKIFEIQEAERNKERADQRKSMVSTGDRSAKIRTYNFPQGRVTDHRINLTLYKLNEIMDGDLTEVIEALQLEEQKAAMEDL